MELVLPTAPAVPERLITQAELLRAADLPHFVPDHLPPDFVASRFRLFRASRIAELRAAVEAQKASRRAVC